jgi:hypothetical protein
LFAKLNMGCDLLPILPLLAPSARGNFRRSISLIGRASVGFGIFISGGSPVFARAAGFCCALKASDVQLTTAVRKHNVVRTRPIAFFSDLRVMLAQLKRHWSPCAHLWNCETYGMCL